jgi:subtilisin family serine protease
MRRCFYPALFFIPFVIIFLLLTAYQMPNPPRFYYAFNKKIFITPVKNEYTVTFNDVQQASLAKASRIAGTVNLQWKGPKQAIIEVNDNQNIKEVISGLSAGIRQYHPVYKTEKQDLYLTDEVILELKPGASLSAIRQKAGLGNDFTITSKPFYSIIQVPKDADVLAVANKIQETGLTVFAHPNFIAPPEVHQNDPYFNNQYYLQNTGQVFNPVEHHAGTPGADINAVNAWKLTTGHASIIVAVLDQGVTANHPDLPNTRQLRLNGSNFIAGENPDDPSPRNNEAHGNACSGIIAATQNNGEGITGIAPDVRIMPIRILGDGYSASNTSIADAIDFAWQQGAHVLSNSWGFKSTDPNTIPAIVQAIQRAVTLGRGGLGAVVCFSASNSANHSVGSKGEVRFPGNVAIDGVLTVGASDRNDQQADYSPSCNTASAQNQVIDIVAPSHKAFSPEAYAPGAGGIANEGNEIWTLDIPGTAGFNPWNNPHPVVAPAPGEVLPAEGSNYLAYTARMGGTSAACPQVAAVAALILSVNNTFTQQQVFDLLTKHAEKTGGYQYDDHGRCSELGYGRLNACAALSSIPGIYPFSIAGAIELCTTNTYTVMGLPEGAMITGWTSSDPAVATISTDGIATKTGTGQVTFTAAISIPGRCGAATETITVYAGLPPAITGTIALLFDSATTCYLTSASKSYTFMLNPMSTEPGVNNYYWGYYKTKKGSSNQPVQSATGPWFSVGFSAEGKYTLFVQPVNSCGLGTFITKDIKVSADCNQPEISFSVAVSPNPARNILFVTIDQRELPSKKWYQEEAIRFELFTLQTGLRVKEWTSRLRLKQYVLPLFNLRSGMYVLKVTQGSFQQSTKVLLQ